MNPEDLRRALDAYAAAAPDADPRPGVRALLARRRKVRAAAVAGTACLALAAAVGLRGPGATSGLVATDGSSPTPTASYTGEEPSPTPTALPAESTAPAPGDATPGATSTPAASEAAEPPDTRPITVTERGEDGLVIRATLSQRGPVAGSKVTLTVEATDDNGEPQVVSLSWGDASEPGSMTIVDCWQRGSLLPTLSPSPTPSPVPGRLDTSFTHAWSEPGRYVVVLKVQSDGHCTGGGYENATIRIPVTVRH